MVLGDMCETYDRLAIPASGADSQATSARTHVDRSDQNYKHSPKVSSVMGPFRRYVLYWYMCFGPVIYT